jgi:hypothetical protein
MEIMLTRKTEGREVEDYRSWPLRQRLELLAFDARRTCGPQELLAALWEAIQRLALPHGATRTRLRVP